MTQVATLALCLLSGCYGHAGDIVRIMGEQVIVRIMGEQVIVSIVRE